MWEYICILYRNGSAPQLSVRGPTDMLINVKAKNTGLAISNKRRTCALVLTEEG